MGYRDKTKVYDESGHEFDYFDDHPIDDPFFGAEQIYKEQTAKAVVKAVSDYLVVGSFKELMVLIEESIVK